MKECIELVKKYIKDPSHDHWHAIRVYNIAMFIQKHEGGNKEIIKYAALLHDLCDRKTLGSKGYVIVENFLNNKKLSPKTVEKILNIIKSLGFKAQEKDQATCIEEAIVKDADKIDAIGAIGIARAFTYGGEHKRVMYDPTENIEVPKTRKEYLNLKSNSTIAHFYQKLLLLKDQMITETGKKLAEERHNFMVEFLENFFNEWYGVQSGVKKVD